MTLPLREKNPDERYYALVSALGRANGRIADLEKALEFVMSIIIEMTTAQNQWSSQAAEQAKRIREKVKEHKADGDG
jgi:hypothetical protein